MNFLEAITLLEKTIPITRFDLIKFLKNELPNLSGKDAKYAGYYIKNLSSNKFNKLDKEVRLNIYNGAVVFLKTINNKYINLDMKSQDDTYLSKDEKIKYINKILKDLNK